jgi:hypothetical protein
MKKNKLKDKAIDALCHKIHVSGLIFMACGNSLVQDFYGQEGMIKRIQENWIPWYYTVPIAIIVMLFSVGLFITSKKEIKELDEE